MASAQDWKDCVLAQTQDSDHIQTAEALAELLDGASSPADIAEKITSIYEPPPETRKEWFHEGQNHKVIEFWGIHMHEAVSTFGDAATQDRLIDLLVEMSKQPDVKNPDGSLKGSAGGTYWKDLPDWEWQFSYYGIAYKRAEEYSPEGFGRSDYFVITHRMVASGSIMGATTFVAYSRAMCHVTCRVLCCSAALLLCMLC